MSGLVIAALLVGASIYAATVCVVWKLARPEKSPVPTRHHVISVMVGSGIIFPLAVLVAVFAVAVVAALCLVVVLYVGLMIGIWDAQPWYEAIPVSALLTTIVLGIPALMFWVSPRPRRPNRSSTRR